MPWKALCSDVERLLEQSGSFAEFVTFVNQNNYWRLIRSIPGDKEYCEAIYSICLDHLFKSRYSSIFLMYLVLVSNDILVPVTPTEYRTVLGLEKQLQNDFRDILSILRTGCCYDIVPFSKSIKCEWPSYFIQYQTFTQG